jgi:hypothetical protein
MRKINTPNIIIIALLVFISCQRELYFTDIPSSGTLKSNISGDCLPSSVHGFYKAATEITNDNFIEVTADIKTPGLFTIVSDTVNGYYFFAAGKFEKKGISTVQLLCTGKPIIGGTNIFTIKYDTSICKITIVADTVGGSSGGGGGTPAVYTLGGSPTDCAPFVLSGSFIADYPLNNLVNTAQVEVNVTSIGNYSISTNTVNGIKFSASGTFINIGIQTIYLRGTGTPSSAGKYLYAASGGGHTCNFFVETEPHGKFTFSGAPGNCLPVTVEGVYKMGDILTTANKVTIEVNVVSTGSYIISTDNHDGFSFYATGKFVTTGLQNVVLQASPAIPSDSGIFSFTAQPNDSTCRFIVNVL